MFCPQCGSTQDDNLRFCKSCGANLHALRRVLASRDESDEKFDWSKTWVAEMFMSSEDAVKRQAAIDRLQGKTPEVKRQNEIKAGVITGSVGVALMIFLFVFMQGLIASGAVSGAAAVIISRIWLAGLIPLFIGAALIFNGTVISKRGKPETVDPHRTEDGSIPSSLHESKQVSLPPAATNPLGRDIFSVTDETTRNLVEPPVSRK